MRVTHHKMKLPTYTIIMYCGEPMFDPPVPLSALERVSHQGQCDADVQAFIDAYSVTCGDRDGLRAWLWGFGGWTATDLSDHDANVQRAVWLMAGDCVDDCDGSMAECRGVDYDA